MNEFKDNDRSSFLIIQRKERRRRRQKLYATANRFLGSNHTAGAASDSVQAAAAALPPSFPLVARMSAARVTGATTNERTRAEQMQAKCQGPSTGRPGG